MFGENAPHVGFVVLAADCQDDAASLELQQRMLEALIDQADIGDLADFDAVIADVAENAAPQRIVQIEDRCI